MKLVAAPPNILQLHSKKLSQVLLWPTLSWKECNLEE